MARTGPAATFACVDLQLRPVRLSDEAAFRVAHASLWETDGFTFGLHLDPQAPFADFIDLHARLARGVDLPEDFVPSTFLLAVVDGAIVGRVSIRHELNTFLAAEGGHIGYGVVVDHRGYGYATEMLRQSLAIAPSLGVEAALLVCDESNAASQRVIERCGGALVSTGTAGDGTPLRRYEIELTSDDG